MKRITFLVLSIAATGWVFAATPEDNRTMHRLSELLDCLDDPGTSARITKSDVREAMGRCEKAKTAYVEAYPEEQRSAVMTQLAKLEAEYIRNLELNDRKGGSK